MTFRVKVSQREGYKPDYFVVGHADVAIHVVSGQTHAEAVCSALNTGAALNAIDAALGLVRPPVGEPNPDAPPKNPTNGEPDKDPPLSAGEVNQV